MMRRKRKNARGCLMGQCAGDALGSLVEFLSPASIRKLYPEGVRLMAAGGTFNTLAGQPTDDSEMALALAGTLIRLGRYDQNEVLSAYRAWYASGPFDCGHTVACGLNGRPSAESQANGALMRVSPLGIFGALALEEQVFSWAALDSALTHPHIVCQEINGLFACAIAKAIDTGMGSSSLYTYICSLAGRIGVCEPVFDCIRRAEQEKPKDYLSHQGWVLIAFQNALWQLLHAENFEEGVVDTIAQGGDTDTNAAICGALLGAVYGIEAIPEKWQRAVLSCRPKEGKMGVVRPRPSAYWPVDILTQADQLLMTQH